MSGRALSLRAGAAKAGGAALVRRDAYRAAIVAAAERVFAKHGYAGAKMQDVANEAGIAIATVYATIPGKEELYAAVHEARGRELLARAAAAASGAGGAWPALMAGVEAYASYLTEHRDYLRIQLGEAQPWALDPKFVTAVQRRLWKQGLELSAGVFRAAIAEGAVVDDDPELMVRLMIAAHQVYLVEWVEKGAKEPPRELARRMQDHVRRAFATQGPSEKRVRKKSQPGDDRLPPTPGSTLKLKKNEPVTSKRPAPSINAR